MLTTSSHINRLGLLSLGVSNPYLAHGSDEYPKEGWLVLTYGSWRYVSLYYGFQLPSADGRKFSTGSLSLVRTVLNYQNVTNDPTCKIHQSQTGMMLPH